MNLTLKLQSVVLLFNISLASAQVNVNDLNNKRVASDRTIVWEQVSCGNGGMSNTLRYHPTIPGHVTMLGDMWCSYQSVNNGTRWYNINDYDSDGSFNRQRDLIYSPSSPEFGLSICGSLMYSSQDTGKTWQAVLNCPWYQWRADGLDASSWKSKVGGLGMDPNNKDVWFVGGGKFVRGDQTFSCYENITQAEPHGYRADNEGMLWRTKDGGKTWQNVGGDFHERAQVGVIKINPRNSNQVFAASNYGLYKSEDGGDNWTNIGEGQLDNNILMDLDYYHNAELDTFILYAIDQVQYYADGQSTKCSGGVFMSTDEGETWTNINGNLYLDYNRLASDVQDNYYKYISQWFGITKDQAKATYPVIPTKAIQHFTQLTTDPSRMGALYMGLPSPQTGESILPGRLWTTNNDGKTWTNCARLYNDVWAKDSVYWNERGNPWHENMTLGHESPHMGWGWNYAQRAVRGLDCGVDGSVMMLSDHTTSLSTDHGKTWHQVDEDFTPSGAMVGRGNSDLPGHVVAMDKRQKQTYLGSGEHRLFITADDSPDERQAIKNIMNSVETVSTIAFDPFDGNTVYSTSSRQGGKQYLWRSTNGGYNWSHYGVATPATDKWNDDFYTNALTIDPIQPKYMYHGITRISNTDKANDGGFFRSENGGKTFEQSNVGLPNPVRVNDIQFDPRDTSRKSLFVAAEKYSFNYHSPLTSGGLYHSTDRGLTWNKVNTPSSVEGVQYIKFDHTGRMYITTGYRSGGAGLLYSDDYGKNWKTTFSYARLEFVDVSPFDHNLIAVSARYLSKNPGVYISRDRGLTWSKSNTNIVIPQEVDDLMFDIHDAGIIWNATVGTGFYKGRIKDGDKIQVVDITSAPIQQQNGRQVQLKAEIVHPDYASENITWKSENPSVATVDENGVVTPLKRGSTKIWATAVNGRFSDYTTVSYESLQHLSILNNDTTVLMGESFPLKLDLIASIDTSDLVITSTDLMVATVVNNKVHTNMMGTVQIRVETKDGAYSDVLNLTVKDPQDRYIIATPDTVKMVLGDTVKIYVARSENVNAEDIVFTTKNKKVATVSNAGLITAVSIGNTEVYAIWTKSLSSKFSIYVEVVDKHTGITRNTVKPFQIHPTPVEFGQNVSLGNDPLQEIRVYDMQGVLQYEVSQGISSPILETKHLARGNFLVYVKKANKWNNGRLVIR